MLSWISRKKKYKKLVLQPHQTQIKKKLISINIQIQKLETYLKEKPTLDMSKKLGTLIRERNELLFTNKRLQSIQDNQEILQKEIKQIQEIEKILGSQDIGTEEKMEIVSKITLFEDIIRLLPEEYDMESHLKAA